MIYCLYVGLGGPLPVPKAYWNIGVAKTKSLRRHRNNSNIWYIRWCIYCCICFLDLSNNGQYWIIWEKIFWIKSLRFHHLLSPIRVNFDVNRVSNHNNLFPHFMQYVVLFDYMYIFFVDRHHGSTLTSSYSTPHLCKYLCSII